MVPGDTEDMTGAAFPHDGWRKVLWPLLIDFNVRNFGVSINRNEDYASADIAIGLENWLAEAIMTPRTIEELPADFAVDVEEDGEVVD